MDEIAEIKDTDFYLKMRNQQTRQAVYYQRLIMAGIEEIKDTDFYLTMRNQQISQAINYEWATKAERAEMEAINVT